MSQSALRQSALLVVALATCAFLGCSDSRVPFTRQWRLDRACTEAGIQFWDRWPESDLDHRTRPTSLKAFYSTKIDTCVQVESNELEFFYDIRDVTHGFLKDEQLLFHCDRDGTDNVVLSKAREGRGYSGEGHHYAGWLDNGEGGLPRAVKTPPNPYKRADCERLLTRKLLELR